MMRKLHDGRWGALALMGIATLCCWTVIQPLGIRATEPSVPESLTQCIDWESGKVILPRTGDPEIDDELVRQLSDAIQKHYGDQIRRQKEFTWRQWQGTHCGAPGEVPIEKRDLIDFACNYFEIWDLGSEARKADFASYFDPQSDLICVGWNVVVDEIEEFEGGMFVRVKANPKLSSLVHHIPFTPRCLVETWKISANADPVCLERKLEGYDILICN
jgi:hypothetical protein